MASRPLVLVTGGSGFLGAHVVDRLLHEGYRVRGTVRSAKVLTAQDAYAAYGNRIEIIGMDDLIQGDFTSALKGVEAVIHLASPLPGCLDAAATLDAATNGTLNVIRQAASAGIKQFSIISSIASVWDVAKESHTFTDKDWNPVTKEQVLDGTQDPMFVYSASKTLAERAVWEFADEHPDLSITTLNPTFFVGPFAPGFRVKPGDTSALSTDEFIYRLLFPDTKASTPKSGFVDVRDVASALVAALKVPGRNRILLTGEWFDYKDAIDYIASVHPELKARLATVTPTGQTRAPIDNTKAMEILRIPKARPWQNSIGDAVNSLLQLEKGWIDQGVKV